MGEPNWRPEVRAFADLMEAKLSENDHKRGWATCSVDWLRKQMEGEAWELHDAVRSEYRGERTSPEALARIGRECADVANYAMMIADVCGALPASAAVLSACQHNARDGASQLNQPPSEATHDGEERS